MIRRKQKRFDSAGIGFLLGFSVPVLVFFLVYLFSDQDEPFKSYISNMWRLHALVKLASLCIFANILTFMGFIRLKYDQSARGVLGATIIYGLAILISRAF